MPGFIKTPEDERLWTKAKALAAEQGHKEDWAYITGIWKRMTKQAKDLIPGGLAEGKKPSDFDPDQLAKGQKVEMEHTSEPSFAQEIAMDHLTEDPNYYQKLEKMEKEGLSRLTGRYLRACMLNDREMSSSQNRVAQRFLRASMSRHCEFYKAKNGKWYMDLAPNEYGDYRDANTYGPFQSLDAAEKYLSNNFSNPGADDVDESGDRPVPVKSPNGRPVTKPSSGRTWWS